MQCQFPRLIFYVSCAASLLFFVFFFFFVFLVGFHVAVSIWSFRVCLNKRHDLRFVLLSLLFVLCTINNLRTMSRLENQANGYIFMYKRNSYRRGRGLLIDWNGLRWIFIPPSFRGPARIDIYHSRKRLELLSAHLAMPFTLTFSQYILLCANRMTRVYFCFSMISFTGDSRDDKENRREKSPPRGL